MNETERDRPGSELSSMYRDQRSGESSVEPAPGLDRLIRARAEAAVEPAGTNRRLGWFGGLATASVAIVAIAVVLQQSPTGQDARIDTPNGDGPAGTLDRPEAESPQPPQPVLRASEQTAAQAPPEIARRNRGIKADVDASPAAAAGEVNSFAERPPPDADAAEGERIDSVGRADAAIGDDPGRWIARIREMIARGDIEAARFQAERLRQADPDLALPEDIRSLLASGEAESAAAPDSSTGGNDEGRENGNRGGL